MARQFEHRNCISDAALAGSDKSRNPLLSGLRETCCLLILFEIATATFSPNRKPAGHWRFPQASEAYRLDQKQSAGSVAPS